MMPTLRVACTAAVIALATTAVADTVSMRSSVRLAADARAVTLDDIATLEGDEARRYADLVVAPVPETGGVFEIAVGDVRAALDAADAHWGLINLSGSRVIVRPRPRASSSPLAMAPAALEAKEKPRPTRANDSVEIAGADVRTEHTVRGAMVRLLAQGLRVDPANLRVLVRPQHVEILARPIETHVALHPTGSLQSDRVVFNVRSWEGGRATDLAQIAVQPRLRRSVDVLVRAIARGEMIGASDVERTTEWLSPVVSSLTLSPGACIGLTASQRLPAATIVRRTHVDRRDVVERGDQVTVHCRSGGVVIQMPAEARGSGAVGDRIECRNIGTRAIFNAVVTGRGEVTVDLNDTSHGDRS